LPASREQGGLSGAPLKALATAVIAKLRRRAARERGDHRRRRHRDAADAREKLDAGANLVQLYTELV